MRSVKLKPFLCLLTLTLSACNFVPSTNSASNNGNKHLHNLEVRFDFERHWVECTECGFIVTDLLDINSDEVTRESEQRVIDSGVLFMGETHELSVVDYHEEDTEYSCVCGFRMRMNNDYSYDAAGHWYDAYDLRDGSAHKMHYEKHRISTTETVSPTYEEQGYDILSCECGYSYKSHFVKKLEHNYADEWLSDEEHHWKECIDQGYEDEIGYYGPHSYSTEKVHEADPKGIHGGYSYYQCVCGAKKDIEYEYSALELESLKYLDISLNNNYSFHINVHQDDNKEVPSTIVIPNCCYFNSEWKPIDHIHIFNDNVGFNGCAGVENLYLPDSLELDEFNAYGNWFNGFTDLKNIYIGESNTHIKSVDGVLYLKDGASLVYVPPFNVSSLNSETLVLTNIDTIYGYCFSSSTIRKVYVHDDVKKIQENAFYHCNNISKSYISINSEADYMNIGGGLKGEKHLYPKGNTFIDTDEITEFVVPDGTKTIRNKTFANCVELTSINIPDSVYDLGAGTFENCKYIYHVKDGVSYLGNDNNNYVWLMGVNDRNITSLFIKQGCRYISDYAFNNCNKLKTLSIPSGFKGMNQYSLNGCELDDIYFNLESTDDWFTISGIDWYEVVNSYKNAHLLDKKGDEIKEITTPSNCEALRAYAFARCRNLQTINITEKVKNVGTWTTFDATSALRSINIVSNNQYYSSIDGVLYNKDTTILIRYPIYKEGTIFDVPSSVKELSPSAFKECSKLDTVNLTNNVTIINAGVFTKSSITTFKLPNSITSISSSMFEICSKLKRVIIPTKVTSIGFSAFYGCDALSEVLYEGTNEEWNKISIDSNNTPLDIAKIYFYSNTKPETGGNYWYYDSDGSATIWR